MTSPDNHLQHDRDLGGPAVLSELEALRQVADAARLVVKYTEEPMHGIRGLTNMGKLDAALDNLDAVTGKTRI